jgi:hypothetical protein
MTSPARPCGGWGSSLTDSDCCTFVLHEHQKSRFQDRNWSFTWVELRGFEPLTPSMLWCFLLSAGVSDCG